MDEFVEIGGRFLWGLAKGVVKGVVKDFEHHYDDEVHQHPAESVGVAFGHAIGATIQDYNPFSSN